MTKQEFVSTLNRWGEQSIPFLFIVDFEMQIPLAFPLDTLDRKKVLFSINGYTNHEPGRKIAASILHRSPVSFEEYNRKFQLVYSHLSYGDSYLTNLTSRTEVELNHSLLEFYNSTAAKYKLFYDDKFLVFSPECFIRIKDGKIYSFPMKGTIDASIPDAATRILSDNKELAEHVTIVDLIRNDLSQVASNVQVTRFRYLEEIRTMERNLLQVSSEVIAFLEPGYERTLGEIIVSLLPAGSVSGAPKPKTLQIIKEAEKENRGYYTGVFGYFDGRELDSGVMIRFIEKDNGRYFYRSGGGITTQSIAEKEYQEIIDKVYVPVT
jgi:para-aminobenzoate synthetase component I